MTIVIQEIKRERIFNIMFPVIVIGEDGYRTKTMHLIQELSEYLAEGIIEAINEMYEYDDYSNSIELEIPHYEIGKNNIVVTKTPIDKFLVFSHKGKLNSQYSFIIDKNDAQELSEQLGLILSNPKMYHNVIFGEWEKF